jgi:hypothetical protein
MKLETAKKLITKQLKDLDVKPGSDAYRLIYEQSINAADVLTRAELIKMIEELIDTLPLRLFY